MGASERMKEESTMFRVNRVCLGMLVAVVGWVACRSAAAAEECCSAKRWKLGMQVYTLRQYTLFEALDICKKLGIKYIEMYPGQRLSPDHKRVVFSHGAPVKYREIVKKKLSENGQVALCYGVVGLGKDEAANRKVFDFAKDMGIQTIVSEPPFDAFDVLDKLVEEYGINVAIHNHPPKSRYWDYKTVLKAVKGHSKRIGACADTGHWMRAKIVPVEALKALRGRIISLHFKDLNKMGRPGEHDVPWGTGVGNARAMLEELKNQGFTGVVSIEYEHITPHLVDDLAKCVAWFNKTTAELYGKK